MSKQKKPLELHIVLTHKWFDQIARGEKTTEYRVNNKFWADRVCMLEEGDWLVFHRGYTNNTIRAKYKKLDLLEYEDLPADVQKFMESKKKAIWFFAIDFEVVRFEQHFTITGRD